MIRYKLLYSQIFTVLVFGALIASSIITTFSFFKINNYDSYFYSISYGPWLEEGLKYFVILILIFKLSLKIKTVPFIGVGFGFVEGIRYFEILGYFSIFSFFAHIIFGLVMALFFHLAKSNYQNQGGIWYSLSFLIPLFLHLTYNLVLVGK